MLITSHLYKKLIGFFLLLGLFIQCILNSSIIISQASYPPPVVNTVDADSDIDSVDNWAKTDWPWVLNGDYNDTHDTDYSYQALSEYSGAASNTNNVEYQEGFDDPSDFEYNSTMIDVSGLEVTLASDPKYHESHAKFLLEEGSGGTVQDSINHYNGTLENGTFWGDGIGNFDHSLGFLSGSESWVNLSVDGTDGVGNWEVNDSFSISVWSYHLLGGAYGAIVSKQASNLRGWCLYHYYNHLYFDMTCNWVTPTRLVVQSSDIFPTSDNILVTITYDGSSNASGVQMYWNTTQKSLNTIQDTLTPYTTIRGGGTCCLGCRRVSDMFETGVIYACFMFDHVLNSSEIDWLYNGGDGTTTSYGVNYFIPEMNNATVYSTQCVSYSSCPQFFTYIGEIPNDCDLQFQLSNDNGSTWYFFSYIGSSWLREDQGIEGYPITNSYEDFNSTLRYFSYWWDDGGNWTVKIFLNTTVSYRSPSIQSMTLYFGQFGVKWEHQFQSVSSYSGQKYNLSILIYPYSEEEIEENKSMYIQYWTGSSWTNVTVDGSVPLISAENGEVWYNWTVDALSVIGNNITIQYVQWKNSSTMTTYYLDYVELTIWFESDYGIPVFSSWSNSSLDNPAFQDVELFAVIYDEDNTSGQLIITIYYSNDSFTSDNRTHTMVYDSSPASDTYNFTYTWTGEYDILYYFYYTCSDGSTIVYENNSGSFYNIQWGAIGGGTPSQFEEELLNIFEQIFKFEHILFVGVLVAFVSLFLLFYYNYFQKHDIYKGVFFKLNHRQVFTFKRVAIVSIILMAISIMFINTNMNIVTYSYDGQYVDYDITRYGLVNQSDIYYTSEIVNNSVYIYYQLKENSTIKPIILTKVDQEIPYDIVYMIQFAWDLYPNTTEAMWFNTPIASKTITFNKLCIYSSTGYKIREFSFNLSNQPSLGFYLSKFDLEYKIRGGFNVKYIGTFANGDISKTIIFSVYFKVIEVDYIE